MKKVDLWYGNEIKDVDKIDISFSDIDCVYRGNMFINGKMVGDYETDDSLKLEKMFPQLQFNWGKERME